VGIFESPTGTGKVRGSEEYECDLTCDHYH